MLPFSTQLEGNSLVSKTCWDIPLVAFMFSCCSISSRYSGCVSCLMYLLIPKCCCSSPAPDTVFSWLSYTALRNDISALQWHAVQQVYKVDLSNRILFLGVYGIFYNNSALISLDSAVLYVWSQKWHENPSSWTVVEMYGDADINDLRVAARNYGVDCQEFILIGSPALH